MVRRLTCVVRVVNNSVSDVVTRRLVTIEPHCEAVIPVHLLHRQSSSESANKGLRILEPCGSRLRDKGLYVGRNVVSAVDTDDVAVKADLHDATLTHPTSLRQAYDMISDHLHAHDIFSYEILKYANVCTRIYGAKVLRNGNQIFWLSCALKKLSNEMFFALIRSVLFEKRLHVN